MHVITYQQARRHLSEAAVRHRLATGRWQRVHRCVLVTHNGPLTPGERRAVALLAVGQDAFLAGLTALALRGYETPAIHLLVPAGRRARNVPTGVVVHRRARRRRLLLQTVDDVVGGAESLAEIDFFTLCRADGLPEPTRQAVRRDAAGRRRYLDALFAPWGVHVEVDGGHHLEVRQAWADMRRQNDLWIAGSRVLRFPAWAIRSHPADVLTQLRAALTAAGWRG